MSRWFRMYDELLDDPKVQKLSPDDFKGWVNLLCLASRNGGKLPCEEDIAFALRETPDAVSTLLGRLLNGGLIERRSGGADGAHYAPYKWNERQYKSDTSTDRVKRFRQRSSNADETPPDTETEAETEVSEANASSIGTKQILAEKKEAIASCLRAAWSCPAGVNPDHWRDFLAARKRKRCVQTQTALDGVLSDLARIADDEWPPGKLVQFAAAKGWASINDPRDAKYGQSTSNVTSLRGSRPDPALDLYRAACAAEDREDNLRAGPSLPALGSSGP